MSVTENLADTGWCQYGDSIHRSRVRAQLDNVLDDAPVGVIASLLAIANERQRQDAKWGYKEHHPLLLLAIAGEEMGEASEATLLLRSGAPDDLDRLYDNLLDEWVQVGACAAKAVEHLRLQRAGHLSGLRDGPHGGVQ